MRSRGVGLGPRRSRAFEQVKWRVRVNYSYEKITARNVICFRDYGPETK